VEVAVKRARLRLRLRLPAECQEITFIALLRCILPSRRSAVAPTLRLPLSFTIIQLQRQEQLAGQAPGPPGALQGHLRNQMSISLTKSEFMQTRTFLVCMAEHSRNFSS
jgi:hypothetical protein